MLNFLVLVLVTGQDESPQTRWADQRVADLVSILIGYSPQISTCDGLPFSCTHARTLTVNHFS